MVLCYNNLSDFVYDLNGIEGQVDWHWIGENHMVNISDLNRNIFMLKGVLAECGYDWWRHSFTGRHSITGEEKAFFIEFFTCNPALGGEEPILRGGRRLFFKRDPDTW